MHREAVNWLGIFLKAGGRELLYWSCYNLHMVPFTFGFPRSVLHSFKKNIGRGCSWCPLPIIFTAWWARAVKSTMQWYWSQCGTVVSVGLECGRSWLKSPFCHGCLLDNLVSVIYRYFQHSLHCRNEVRIKWRKALVGGKAGLRDGSHFELSIYLFNF